MSIRLACFPIHGRGEQIRLLLHALEVSFEAGFPKMAKKMRKKLMGGSRG